MGNILTQKRHKQNGTQIEDMTYRYQRDANGFLLSNRLYHVNDAIASTIDQTDIDDQGAGFNPLNVNINGAYNYVYDEEGRLVKDVTEGINQIVWRVDGKVREINRTSTSTRSRLKFDYDAMGRRIAKHVYNNQTGLLIKSTYYLLDAQGNTMSTYDYAPGPNQTMSYQLKERHIFGSARIGMYAESVVLVENPSTENSNILVNQGFKQYELTNHLGNVLTVIHDIKIPLNNSSGPTVSSYRVGIRTCSDYSPFGVELDGRTVSGGYRYGYQGSEKDAELKGNGNSYTTEFRQLDPRLGRWLSIDQKTSKFPNESPYVYVANTPIICVDPDGEEKIVVSGGADLHNKNRMNFASAAKNQIREFKKEIKKANSTEKISWLVLNVDYNSKEIESIEAYAKMYGVNLLYVKSDEEITNYINSKSKTNLGLNTERQNDQITSLSFMSHGVSSALVLGYENTNWEKDPSYSNPTVISNESGNNDIETIDKDSFSKNCSITLYTCNSATPINMTAKDYLDEKTLVDDAMTGDNLVKSISNQIPQAKVTGFIGQTSYSKVGIGNGMGELPQPATMDGSYSPTVNGKPIPTLKITMKDGKVQ